MEAKDRTRAAIIFALALAVRLAILWQLHDVPLFRTPQLDSREYLDWATSIAGGDLTWPDTPFHGPGYPFFLAQLLTITRSLTGARVAQAIVGSLGAVLLFLVTRRMYGPRAAVAAGMLAALYGPLAFTDISIYGEGLLVFLLIAVAYVSVVHPDHKWAAAVAGLAFGTAIIVRPTAAVLLPLFVRRKTVLPFVLLMTIPVVPVMLHNWRASADFVAVQASGGMNFYIGNEPHHDGTAWARPGGQWDEVRGAAWRSGARGASREDRYYVREALKRIGQEPVAYVQLLFTKMLWIVQDDEIRDSHSFQFFKEQSSVLRALPGFGVVFGLAFAGLFFERSHWRTVAWLALMAATLLLLVAGFRYRLPMVPPLLILAGAGFDVLSRARGRRLALIAGCAVVAFMVTKIRSHAPSHNFAEEQSMTALSLLREGDLNAAHTAAADAARIAPASSLSWLTLGDIEARRDRWPEAEAAWRRAIAANPNTARAWSHLAIAFMRRNDTANAKRALLRAIAIKQEPEAMENLTLLRSR